MLTAVPVPTIKYKVKAFFILGLVLGLQSALEPKLFSGRIRICTVRHRTLTFLQLIPLSVCLALGLDLKLHTYTKLISPIHSIFKHLIEVTVHSELTFLFLPLYLSRFCRMSASSFKNRLRTYIMVRIVRRIHNLAR